jgi:hypothetical protein
MWSPFFICGCPRSGTSALRNVFNADARFAIGMERYYFKAANSFELNQSLFEKERFFSLKEGDTFWTELTAYDGMKPTFDNSIYRGDKIPKLYNYFDNLFAELPKSKVLFIIRDVLDVATSYNARANNKDDKNWSREQDYKIAVDDWNASLVSLYQSLYEKKRDVIPVFYEEFFSNNDSVAVLYKKLNMTASDAVKNNFSTFVIKYKSLQSKGNEKSLNAFERDYINKNANFKLYQWIKNYVK